MIGEVVMVAVVVCATWLTVIVALEILDTRRDRKIRRLAAAQDQAIGIVTSGLCGRTHPSRPGICHRDAGHPGHHWAGPVVDEFWLSAETSRH